MADHDLEMAETFSPSSCEIDFLTEKINEESRAQNISSDAYPFGIFLRRREISKKNSQGSQLEENNPAATSSSSSGMESNTTQLHEAAHHLDNNAKHEAMDSTSIVGGCNGSIVYGSIYTDQLWVDPRYRGKGVGKKLMEKVHDMGRTRGCRFATVGTMDFQGAQSFYERLGYEVEFEREGYDNGGKMIYLKKTL